MTERIGANAYNDVAPVAATTNTLVGKGYFGNNATTSMRASQNYTDAEVNLIMPLTKRQDRCSKRASTSSTTGGSTAGHLGTAWAWYLLSPNWNTVLPTSPASAAGPYSDLTVTNSKGMPKLRKIAVLMTDGDYNINYCKGVEAKNSDQSPDINCNSENGKSLVQAGNLCTRHEERQDRGLHGRLPGRTRRQDVPEGLRDRRRPLLRCHDRRSSCRRPSATSR